jgi:hypothetical protein
MLSSSVEQLFIKQSTQPPSRQRASVTRSAKIRDQYASTRRRTYFATGTTHFELTCNPVGCYPSCTRLVPFVGSIFCVETNKCGSCAFPPLRTAPWQIGMNFETTDQRALYK